MDLFKDTVDNAVKQIDQLAQARINQIDQVLDSKLDKFQEMLNGIKITVNVEMPVVKKAEPV